MSFEAYWALSDESRLEHCRALVAAIVPQLDAGSTDEDLDEGELQCEGEREGRAVRVRVDVPFGAVTVEVALANAAGELALVRRQNAGVDVEIQGEPDVAGTEKHDVAPGIFMEDVPESLAAMVSRLAALSDPLREAIVESINAHGLVSLTFEADFLDGELEQSPLDLSGAPDVVRVLDRLIRLAGEFESSTKA